MIKVLRKIRSRRGFFQFLPALFSGLGALGQGAAGLGAAGLQGLGHLGAAGLGGLGALGSGALGLFGGAGEAAGAAGAAGFPNIVPGAAGLAQAPLSALPQALTQGPALLSSAPGASALANAGNVSELFAGLPEVAATNVTNLAAPGLGIAALGAGGNALMGQARQEPPRGPSNAAVEALPNSGADRPPKPGSLLSTVRRLMSGINERQRGPGERGRQAPLSNLPPALSPEGVPDTRGGIERFLGTGAPNAAFRAGINPNNPNFSLPESGTFDAFKSNLGNSLFEGALDVGTGLLGAAGGRAASEAFGPGVGQFVGQGIQQAISGPIDQFRGNLGANSLVEATREAMGGESQQRAAQASQPQPLQLDFGRAISQAGAIPRQRAAESDRGREALMEQIRQLQMIRRSQSPQASPGARAELEAKRQEKIAIRAARAARG